NAPATRKFLDDAGGQLLIREGPALRQYIGKEYDALGKLAKAVNLAPQYPLARPGTVPTLDNIGIKSSAIAALCDCQRLVEAASDHRRRALRTRPPPG